MLIGIYTSQRCGSNLCESLLHRYNVKPFGEQFCFDENGLITDKHPKTEHPVTHMHKLISECAPGNYSVRIMTSHFKHYDEDTSIEKMLSVGQMCDHIIILKREFFFKYTSQKIADITGQWVSFGEGKSGFMGLGEKFSKLYKKPKQSKRKPVFDPNTYTKWKKGYENRFIKFNQMFPEAHNITYRGMLNSNLDVHYIIPASWGVDLVLDESVSLPVKQVKENKTGSEPWDLYENSDVAKQYYMMDDNDNIT